MESLKFGCKSCEVSFESHDELERHYVHSHLDMTNEP